MKKILQIHRGTERHWVGDGFHVSSLFTYDDLGQETLSPFLLMDYAAPESFPAGKHRPGVGEHPHRGFETVTLAFQGEVEHRDSGGGGGKIGPGDVQWMTAASGVMHEEMHSQAFAEKGGVFEMIQLWINLPAKDKMRAPRYQTLLAAEIPAVSLPGGGGRVRVVAGRHGGVVGPAKTFSPVDLWDIELKAGARLALDLPEGNTAAVFVRHGRVALNGGPEKAGDSTLAILSREGRTAELAAETDSALVFLGGRPLGEPVVGYGPFVMTTKQEIAQAVADVRSGRFTRLAPAS